ncbi:hypothetical protein ACTFIV_004543 [Dictyostelium citrinum]
MDGTPLLSSPSFSNDLKDDEYYSIYGSSGSYSVGEMSPTITSSLINSVDKNSSDLHHQQLNYNTININKNSNSNINNNNINNINNNDSYRDKDDNNNLGTSSDNIFSLFYNQSILYQNYYTDCRILVITGEEDVIRITLDELFIIIEEIRKLDSTLSSTIQINFSETTPTTTITTNNNNNINNSNKKENNNQKINLIVQEYFNNPEKSFWIDVYGLQDDELITLCKALSIHHLNVEDILSNDTNEKCESHDNYLFIATSEMGRHSINGSKNRGLHKPNPYSNTNNNNNNIKQSSTTSNSSYKKNNNNNNNNNNKNGNNDKELIENFFYMFLFKRIIFVLHSVELDSFNDVFKSFRHLKNEKKILTSPEWVLCNFLESINDLISLESDRMMAEVSKLDEFCDLKEPDNNYNYYDEEDDEDQDYYNRKRKYKSFIGKILNFFNDGGGGGGGGESDDYLNSTELYIRIGKASKRNTNILSNLFNKDVLLSSLSRQSFTLRDTQIFILHINNKSKRLKERIKLCEELLEGIHANYINKVSLVLNEESHALTISMKKFANYSLVSFPLILIATIFGMNCRVPGMIDFLEEGESGVIYFYIIIISMLIIGILTSYLYKKIGWIE